MNRLLYIVISIFTLIIIAGTVLWYSNEQEVPEKSTAAVRPTISQPTSTPPPVRFKTPPPSYALPQSRFVSQSFNNCGPASLSMVMSMFGTFVDQETLADRMRPFHNPAGGVDDKSIFAEEFVTYAEENGFKALQRPNGDIELLKKFVANDIPVVVRTWLNMSEDIGHFRIVRGYNDETRTILQDDSYQGPNLSYTYDDFLAMWQPFNYGYILVYPPEKQAVVEAILGEDKEAATAYRSSIERAEEEIESCGGDSSPSAQNDISCAYPHFNIASANYYLGNYEETISHYEQVASRLPGRMLWYQIEPIQAYQKIGQDEAVFQLTDRILNTGNMAYSELYQMRGEIYKKQGNTALARQEFEKAVRYNVNYRPAKEALESF